MHLKFEKWNFASRWTLKRRKCSQHWSFVTRSTRRKSHLFACETVISSIERKTMVSRAYETLWAGMSQCCAIGFVSKQLGKQSGSMWNSFNRICVTDSFKLSAPATCLAYAPHIPSQVCLLLFFYDTRNCYLDNHTAQRRKSFTIMTKIAWMSRSSTFYSQVFCDAMHECRICQMAFHF